MARILGQVDNKMTFRDNLSGSEVVLFYRHPSTEERAAYTNMSLQRQGNDLLVRRGEARMQYGLEIITGFRPGDFVDQDGNDLDCNDADWKKKLMDGASDLVELLAAQVFDLSCSLLPAAPAPATDTEETPQGN